MITIDTFEFFMQRFPSFSLTSLGGFTNPPLLLKKKDHRMNLINKPNLVEMISVTIIWQWIQFYSMNKS